MNDRSIGYLIQGKAKTAVSNYGNYVEWSNFPPGLWGKYSYLPRVSFISGIPGHDYSFKYLWTDCSSDMSQEAQVDNALWCSSDAYDAWLSGSDSLYKTIVFETENDRGVIGQRLISKDDVVSSNQWGFDDAVNQVFLSTSLGVDPNYANARIGLAFPWSVRPKLVERLDEFDLYDYGVDLEEWTEDDGYMYYGANTAESWFTRFSPSINTDWQPSLKARINTHNVNVTAGDLFGETVFTDEIDTSPLLAHSNYTVTWPVKYNLETGSYDPFWPGWFAKDYYGDDPTSWGSLGITNCNQTRKDQDCWVETTDRHISDSDVYMEFDDRWAHRGNNVEDNEYIQTGYPMGIRVMSMAHSYGVAYAEDIMFVTVKVRNESGGWYDEDGVYHPAMVMPDGTKLNGGEGFDYKNLTMGFYMDADVVSSDVLGNFGVHTNSDDFMEYYYERFEVNDEEMLISMAMIYDYDGVSGTASDFGIVAVQLLDSPLATEDVDLDQDGSIDIYAGEPLKMTDWHWFDWYNRPGVTTRESNNNCCAGSPSRPGVSNREEIQYKILAGDTTNLTEDEKDWFFHTPNPDTDLGVELNPHFDSLDGLKEEAVFNQGEEGLDCVLEMSSGPFDLAVGEEVPFSFCIIFGQNKEDLIKNARFAQVMYNSNYQGFTPPTTPIVAYETDDSKVKLSWSPNSKYSKDVVTGYSDFEGYKVYRSTDGGQTWGGPEDKVYDTETDPENPVFVGWRPYAQFDLSAYEDSIFCVKGVDRDIVGGSGLYSNWDECIASEDNVEVCCKDNEIRGFSISGEDPGAPWFSLGENTGLDSIYDEETGMYTFTDTSVVNGFEYTYSVTAYDMGVSGANPSPNSNGTIDTLYVANPEKWAAPDGYQSIENSKGTTVYDQNYVMATPSYRPSDNLSNIKVVPNPYIVWSGFEEYNYERIMRFTQLPEKCTITVFTITGEKVIKLEHDNPLSGALEWNVRTVNNQEIAPGLYVFTVETPEGGKHIGKFAVIR